MVDITLHHQDQNTLSYTNLDNMKRRTEAVLEAKPFFYFEMPGLHWWEVRLHGAGQGVIRTVLPVVYFHQKCLVSERH